MAPVTISIVGLGRQGSEHLKAIQTLESEGACSLIAVCDNDPAKMESLPARISRYTDVAEMLGRNRPQAVVVATPNNQHLAICEQALGQGIHVLKEKPLALTMRDAKKLAAAANANSAVLHVSQQRRFHPYYRTALSWLPRLGEIDLISYGFFLNDKFDSWYWRVAKGGGCWYGLGWHAAWVWAFFGGPLQEVHVRWQVGKQRSFTQDTDHSCIAMGSFISGGSALAHLSVVHPFKAEDVVIEGPNGAVVLRRNELILFNSDGTPQIRNDAPFSWEAAYRYQLLDFMDSIAAAEPGVDKFSLWAMSTLSAGRQSARCGLPVKISEIDDTVGGIAASDTLQSLEEIIQ